MALPLNVFKSVSYIARDVAVGFYTAPVGYSGVILLAQVTNVDSTSHTCLLYTSPSPRDGLLSRMPSSA